MRKYVNGLAVEITDDEYAVIHPPGRKEKTERRNKKINAKAYLNETSWYIFRNIETGAMVPEDVKIKRAAAWAVLED